MKSLPRNHHQLIPLIEHFSSIGGYWDINSSEDGNIEIQWSPFLSDKGKFMDRIFMKRCFDIQDYIEYMNRVLVEAGHEENVL